MTAKTKEQREALGCWFIIAIVAFAIGVGCLVGAGFGWLLFGAIMLALVALKAIA